MKKNQPTPQKHNNCICHWFTATRISVQAWSPHFRKDIDLLEGAERKERATKLVSAIEDETYEDRLCYVNLTLEMTVSVEVD